ncbi:MAG TPA: hypothetical protein VF527_11845 [Pyrinomonadaceae bacterium]|jgi:hypothetical protein
MRFVCKTKIEKAWLWTSVSIFVAHRLLENSSSGYYSSADPLRLWLELAMIVLSFPFGGLALLALHVALFWCDDCRNLDFLFDWSTLLFAGYIQWFWVLPEFLRNRKLTVLDLKRTPEIVAHAAAPSVAANVTSTPVASHAAATAVAATTHASLSAATPNPFDAAPHDAVVAVPRALSAAAAPPLPAFDAAAFVPRLAEFDEAGLTALDKVFQAQSTPHAPPSHVEAIFPRVS